MTLYENDCTNPSRIEIEPQSAHEREPQDPKPLSKGELYGGVAPNTWGCSPFFTPVRSPQPKGMAEAFVKTFKRDYVYIHDHPDTKMVMAQLNGWFNDYNNSQPYKGLRLKSPREFIREVAKAI